MKQLCILAVLILFCFGCGEEQKQKLDEAAATVETITGTGQQVLDSPAGNFVPPDYQLWIRAAGVVAIALAGGWQEYRKRQLTKTAKSIVQAIEVSGANIKPLIAKKMQANGIYRQGKAIVQDLKK